MQKPQNPSPPPPPQKKKNYVSPFLGVNERKISTKNITFYQKVKIQIHNEIIYFSQSKKENFCKKLS